jgi:hypothetical protein
MFKGDTWIFADTDPAVVGIDLTTGMKRALITSPDLTHMAFSFQTYKALFETPCIFPRQQIEGR